ncbi:hypothetical protein VLK31_27425 [Variovorax sp. H27-G14]|uniref:hypothetical protein n=1 Tax=Variovorax sp. H27-G14 TaxID=3111914 RepID=UPI0038FC2550
MISRIFVKRLQWACITVEVSYEPNWLGLSIGGEPVAHLQLRSVGPERGALPVSETGYCSRFVSGDEVDACGGPLAFALAWLDEAASLPAWKAEQEAARQFSFF